MFGRKILFLAAGYVAGNMVASIYSGGKKKAKKLQGKEDIKMMVENFIDTQKNLISDIEDKYLSEDNKEKLSEKKKQFLKHSEKYIQQGEKLLAEVSKNEKMLSGKKAAIGFISDTINKGKKFMHDIKSEDIEVKSKK